MTQVSVFVENRVGSVAEVLGVLSDEKINLRALSIADTAEYGIMRLISEENDRLLSVLKAHHYVAHLSEVLTVRMPDEPGALAQILSVLAQNGISLSYLYAYTSLHANRAILVIKVDKPAEARDILAGKGIEAR